jgi:hypothetical protein
MHTNSLDPPASSGKPGTTPLTAANGRKHRAFVSHPFNRIRRLEAEPNRE